MHIADKLDFDEPQKLTHIYWTGEIPLFILGATATGKSDLALALARRLNKEVGPDRAAILCLDAMQVYRDADIGTGKPSQNEREEIPHGGLDLADLGSPFDVGDYLCHAARFLANQGNAGRRVIIVGGTGLYFRALTHGLCEAPEAPPGLREELSRLSTTELQNRLRQVDPAMLEKLDIQNPRRLSRALEVIESTGKSLALWQAETPPPLVPRYTAVWLQREKIDLQDRISKRVKAMLEAGWQEEVRYVVSKYGREAVNRFVAIGYRELAESLLNPVSLKELHEKISLATRQYAKRQLTWFSREDNLNPMLVSALQNSSSVAEVFSF